jgi:hypothetical protein
VWGIGGAPLALATAARRCLTRDDASGPGKSECWDACPQPPAAKGLLGREQFILAAKISFLVGAVLEWVEMTLYTGGRQVLMPPASESFFPCRCIILHYCLLFIYILSFSFIIYIWSLYSIV